MARAQHEARGRFLVPALLVACVLASLAGTCVADPNFGRLDGVVVNPGGTPQMGATVKLVAENAVSLLPTQLFTNQHGVFTDAKLLPGIYELQVTLAGYLPSVQHNIRVAPNVTTIVKVELTTVFASLDRLRSSPQQTSSSDDWKWVLRTAAGTRPILQWNDPQSNVYSSSKDTASNDVPRAQLELTSGSDQPGSISNLPATPATAFSYDQPLGPSGHLLFAAQMSYGQGLPTAGLATVWEPAGNAPDAPVTKIVVRQAWLGTGDVDFRGERISQRDTMELGDRVLLRYGADMIAAQFASDTRSLRPTAELRFLVSPKLQADVMAVSGTASDAVSGEETSVSALQELDSFPVLMVRNSRPVLAGGWHEEAGIQYKLFKHASLEAAAFHDETSDAAVFGRGIVTNPDFLEDPFSNAFAYDAGATGSWGARLAYKQKLSPDYEIAAIYAYAGALAAEAETPDAPPSAELRDALATQYRHSLAARLAGRTHRTGTQFAVSYKWISGESLTRVDSFGEAANEIDPYLSISIRQMLPGSVGNCRWEALADFRNLLGQGYVPVSSQDGQLLLMSAARTFRGGLNFQF